MLGEEQIQILKDDLQKRLKAKGLDEKNNVKPGTFSDYNRECVDLWNEVKTHATKDFPDSLISKKHPSESEEEFNYRKDTYQAITYSYWYKAMNTLNRIWQSYSIIWENEEHKDYFENQYPVHKSIISKFRSVETPQKINDPNTVLAVKPFVIPTIRTEEGVVFDDSELIEPHDAVFTCEHVVDFVQDHYFMGMLNERSMVLHGSQSKRMGLVFELYDDENIYKIVQTGKQSEYTFQVDVSYNHALGYLPCWTLQGIPRHRGDRIVYESYFSPAVPLLNEATIYNSTNSGVISKHGYPTRAYFEEECDNVDCQGGMIYKADKDPESCPICLGTMKKKFTPMSDYVRKMPRATDPDVQFPGIDYITPPTEPMQFLDDKVKEGVVSAFGIINIDVSSIADGQVEESATKSKIDREELFSFLLLFSNEIFNTLSDVINAVGQMRFVDWEPPKINFPDEFSIRSSADLTEEIRTASEANLPDLAQDMLQEEYVKMRFHEDNKSTLYFDLRKKTDALRNKTDQQVSILVGSGNALKWQGVLHTNFDIYLDDFLSVDEKFMESDTAKEQLIARAKADTPSESISERLLNANA